MNPLAAALALTPLLAGCVAAAVVPIAASSTAVMKARSDARRAGRSLPRPTPARWQLQGGMTALPPPTGAPGRAGTVRAVPESMQFLYGSGEGAALGVQAYRALTAYLGERAAGYAAGADGRQVVLADGASLNAPQFEPCGSKPLAIVLDIDETAILNLGFESDVARRGGDRDDPRRQRWETTGAEKVVAVPGAVAAVRAARAAGIAVIFNSNRAAASAAATAAALDHAGLGPVKHGTTLWLQGDDGGASNKDDRRWAIASGYCVVALVGDQLGDFSDLFDDAALTPSTRRALAASPELAPLWSNGWFMLPNPVSGSALKGGFDDVFPIDMRWQDPAEEK